MYMINRNSPYVQYMHSNLYRSHIWPHSKHLQYWTYVQISCTTQYTQYSMYRSQYVQHSTHSTVCTHLMYNTIYTVQYVQISFTTQHTLYSMYRSHPFTHQSDQEMVPDVVSDWEEKQVYLIYTHSTQKHIIYTICMYLHMVQTHSTQNTFIICTKSYI